jgi:hypothetical protein
MSDESMTRDEANAEVARLRAVLYSVSGDLMILIANHKLGKEPAAARATKKIKEALSPKPPKRNKPKE